MKHLAVKGQEWDLLKIGIQKIQVEAFSAVFYSYSLERSNVSICNK